MRQALLSFAGALTILAGCGGTFTNGGAGGSGGSLAQAGTASGGDGNAPGHAGKVTGYGGSFTYPSHGGDVSIGGYGYAGDVSYGGTVSYGGYGGDIIGYGGYGGDIIGYGGYGGDIIGYGGYGYGGYGYGGYGYGGSVSYGGSYVGGDGGQRSTCDVGPPGQSAFPVEFVFVANSPFQSAPPVYIRNDCGFQYQLYSCASDGAPILSRVSCVADCSDTSPGCIACGACAIGAQAVGPGSPVKTTWDGRIFKYGTLPSGCSCASGSPAAPGTYTISIQEYLSAADAMGSTNAFTKNVQFQLPAPNGLVTVDLSFTAL